MARGNILTPAQRQTIIEQRLAGVPVNHVVANTGHARQTITDVFRAYMDETRDERLAEIEQVRETLIAQHEADAYDARQSADVARDNGDMAAHARYLRERRDSLREIARLTGADHPVKLEVSGQVDVNVTVREQREALKARLVALCQSDN